MRLFVPVLVLLGLACAFGPEGPTESDESESKRKSDPSTLVEVAPVGRGSVSDLLRTNATVESESQADIIPQATGIVVSIHKDEGDEVKRGSLLAVIDNVNLDVNAERAQADVARLEQELKQTEALHAKGAVSDQDLVGATFRLKGARTTAREASRTYGQTRLTAPFAGVVARRDVRVGELASGGRPAFQVVDLEELRVVASLPERDVSRVGTGQPARLVSSYDASLWAMGVVTRVAPVVDSASGTFRVTIALDQEQSSLRPGQFVSVELEVDRHEDVVVVPKSALVYEDGTPVVYRMIEEPPKEEGDEDEEDSTDQEMPDLSGWWPFGGLSGDEEGDAQDEDTGPKYIADRAPLTLGLVDDNFAEVLSGVDAGDPIVVIGQSNLKDNARIETEAHREEREAAEKTAADEEKEKAADAEPPPKPTEEAKSAQGDPEDPP